MEAQTYCWICKKVADSAEQRIKKSDLVNLYGSGSYKGKNAVVLIREGQKISVQGPNPRLTEER